MIQCIGECVSKAWFVGVLMGMGIMFIINNNFWFKEKK